MKTDSKNSKDQSPPPPLAAAATAGNVGKGDKKKV
jgi:hypothetical protein